MLNTAHIKRSEIKVKLELCCGTQTVNQHIVKIKCFHMRMVIHHWLHDDLFLFWLQLCLASYHYQKEAWCGFRNLESQELNKNIIFKRNTFMVGSTPVYCVGIKIFLVCIVSSRHMWHLVFWWYIVWQCLGSILLICHTICLS